MGSAIQTSSWLSLPDPPFPLLPVRTRHIVRAWRNREQQASLRQPPQAPSLPLGQDATVRRGRCAPGRRPRAARRPEQPCSSLAEAQAVSNRGAVACLGDSQAVPRSPAEEAERPPSKPSRAGRCFAGNTGLSARPCRGNQKTLCQQTLAGASSLAGCALHYCSSAPVRETHSSPWLSQAMKSSGSALGQAICSLRMLCCQ